MKRSSKKQQEGRINNGCFFIFHQMQSNKSVNFFKLPNYVFPFFVLFSAFVSRKRCCQAVYLCHVSAWSREEAVHGGSA